VKHKKTQGRFSVIVYPFCEAEMQTNHAKASTSAQSVFIYASLSHFPSPALPGSGRMGMISARCIKAPLMICDKGKGEKMAFTIIPKIFIKKDLIGR
jgi:hypothetical protein